MAQRVVPSKAFLPNLEALVGVGIDPKTGLPLKLSPDSMVKPELKNKIRHLLRIVDEQDAINRYKWLYLPHGLTSDILERVLYFKGQGAFFYMASDEKFYFLPYALSGEIDVYGRFLGITPLPFNGTTKTENEQNGEEVWIDGLIKKPFYDILYDDTDIDMKYEAFFNGCVLLKDYTEQISQNVVARSILNEPVLDAMSEAFPLARTNLIANSGIKGMRVNDQDQQATVRLASQSVTKAALIGDPWIPIVGPIEIQELTEGSALKSEEFLIYLQALDNFRLSLYGLGSGGLFQKKAHMLEAEQEMNNGTVNLIYQDGLRKRQEFCNIVNSIWGLGIWCEINEAAIGVDADQDGQFYDQDEQSKEPSSNETSGKEESDEG